VLLEVDVDVLVLVVGATQVSHITGHIIFVIVPIMSSNEQESRFRMYFPQTGNSGSP
jgi:hypothetical protein